VRHETEQKLNESIEKCNSLGLIIRDKDEGLAKRLTELEELDKKLVDMERTNEALEIKKAGLERQFELTKK